MNEVNNLTWMHIVGRIKTKIYEKKEVNVYKTNKWAWFIITLWYNYIRIHV